MGVVRSSDLAVSSAAAVVAWLLVRTALRGSVALSVVCVIAAYFVALWARVSRAKGKVRLPLFEYFAGLCLVRALEFCWDLARWRALGLAGLCAVMSVGAVVAVKRARVGTAIALAAAVVGVAAGEARVATSMLFALWLARAFARLWQRSEGVARWALGARWIAALVALVWAWRGATIGPVALMVGASTSSGGVIDEADREARSEVADVVVFLLAAVGLVLVRAWEGCPLVFV